jgi:hypothetical protein
MAEKQFDQGAPAWTVQEDKQGLDPLGMQNTSITLYQGLLPGISNVTLRVRYYGLHTFLLAQFARKHHSADEDDWCSFLRRGEALYALLAQHNTQDGGVAGTRWATRKLNDAGDRIAFAAATDRRPTGQYLRQKFGAFGAAYSSQLQVVGLITQAEKHALPVPTALGWKLADQFAAEVGRAGTLFLQVAERGHVTPDELTRMAALAPSAIGEDTAERQLYEDLLLAPGAEVHVPAARRRETLRLVLHTASELGWLPDADETRWVSYSGHDGEGNPLVDLPAADAEQRYRWRIYHANDLTHVCHETLLRFVLEVLGEYPAGIPLKPLLDDVVARLLEDADPRPGTWADLEASIDVADNAWSQDPHSEWQLHNELLSVSAKSPLPAATAYEALRLLAVLGLRFRPERERERVAHVLARAAHRTSQTILTEPAFLDARRHQPIERTLADLIKQRVLDRHLAVAFQKLRGGDYTFLFEMEESRLRRRRTTGAVLTNPRLKPAITFLRDIHLLDENGLTDAGARVLAGAG